MKTARCAFRLQALQMQPKQPDNNPASCSKINDGRSLVLINFTIFKDTIILKASSKLGLCRKVHVPDDIAERAIYIIKKHVPDDIAERAIYIIRPPHQPISQSP